MRLAILLCATALSFACGAPAQNTSPETPEAYLKALNQLSCERSFRCCGTACSDAADDAFFKNFSRALDFINQGLLRYDAAAGAICLSGTSARNANCDAPAYNLPKLPPECSKVFLPNTPTGGMCDTSIGNCVTGNVCTNGSCVALPSPGQPCVNGGCVSTAFCDFIVGNVCRALPNPGQPCGPSGQCAMGSYCDATGTPTCTANGTTGAVCTGSRPCDTTGGLICLSNGMCGGPQPDGAACNNSNQCINARCTGATPGSTCQPQLAPQTLRDQVCMLR